LNRKNFEKFIKYVIITAVIIIPILYSFFYLRAFWDPYGNLKDMKIAVVNLDKGDESENLGNDLVDKLKDKDVMTIIVLDDSDKAKEGLINEDYYATITIPENFTYDLNNAENVDRKTTTITYSPNQKSNYLASQIINKVVTSVETELRSQVDKQVVATLSDKLREMPDKLKEISDGAGQLQEGSNKLGNGIEQLNSGTGELNSNYAKFDDGVNSAYNGSVKLTNGLNDLNAGAEKIAEGTAQLAENTKNLPALADKVTQLSGVTNGLQTSVSNYVNAVTNATNILKNYAPSNPDITYMTAMGTLEQLSLGNNSGTKTKGDQLNDGVKALNSSVSQFASQASSLGKLSDGINNLNNGMTELKKGLASAQEGSTTLQNGLKELDKNSKNVKTGINTLNTGSQAALEGTQTLIEGTNTFKSEIDEGMNTANEQLESLNGLDEYAADPAKAEEVDYAGIDSYGVGFAPYFMSISLWVGSLIMLIIFYYDPDDRFKLLGRNAENRFLRSGLYLLISVAQGIVLGVILKFGLGFSVTNLWLYYGSCVVISLVFFSIMQFLILNLGDVGKFLGILFLVLQLAASGGTFPIETVPKFYQSIYKFMPMNYTIRLLKESIVEINTDMLTKNLSILFGIFIVFMGISFTLDYIRTKKQPLKNKN